MKYLGFLEMIAFFLKFELQSRLRLLISAIKVHLFFDPYPYDVLYLLVVAFFGLDHTDKGRDQLD